MPGAIGRLFVTLGMEKKGFDQGAREAKTQTNSLRRSLTDLDTGTDKLTHTLQSLGSAGLMYAAARAAQATWELGKTGATVDRTERSFDRLAGRIGESGDSLLSTMRRVSENTIGDMTLMQTTSGLLASGIKTSTDEIALALDIAQLKAEQFGLSATQAYERMVTGARKGSVEMLDELGINIKAESAYRRRAEALGVTVSALTDAQRAEALWKAILEDGRRELESQGGATQDYASSFEKLDATMANVKDTMAQQLAPAVAEVAELFNLLVTEGQKLQNVKGDLEDIVNVLKVVGSPAVQGMELGKEWFPPAEVNRAQEAMEATERLANAQRTLTTVMGKGNPEAVQYWASMVNLHQAEVDAAVGGDALTSQTWRWRDAAAAAGEESRYLAGYVHETTSAMGTGIGAVLGYADAVTGLANTLFGLRGAMQQIGAIGVEDVIAGLPGAATGLDTTFLGLVGDASSARIHTLRENFVKEIEELYTATALAIENGAEITDFELAMQVEAIEQKYKDMAGTFTAGAEKVSTAVRSTRSVWDEMRGIVQGALRATSVTAEDMGLAAIGQYIEKWDENARRLDAVAERGFGELDAHPDWAAMLKIPESTLAAGEQALKDWARRTAESVRGLERPDLLNIDAAVQAVQDELNRQAAVELSLDLVTQAAIDQGLVTGEDAKEQVAAALGLSQALPVSLTVTDDEKERFVAGLGTVPVPVTFSTGETEGAEAGGLQEMMATAVEGVAAGWEQSLQEVPWMQTLSVTMLADIKASEGRLKEVGAAIGAPLWDGLLGRIRGSGIVNHIVAEVLAALVKETK